MKNPTHYPSGFMVKSQDDAQQVFHKDLFLTTSSCDINSRLRLVSQEQKLGGLVIVIALNACFQREIKLKSVGSLLNGTHWYTSVCKMMFSNSLIIH